MKRTFGSISVLAFVLAGAACSATPASTSTDPVATTVPSPAGGAVQAPKSEKSRATSTETPPTATKKQEMTASLSFVPSDFRKLTKDEKISLVAKGTVNRVQYLHDDVGVCYTLVTLDVDKTWHGPKASTITYMEMGGYIKQSELDAINGPKDGMASADPNDVVDVQFMGAPHSRVGERQLVFLHRIDGDGYDYEALQGPYGTYRWDSASGKWRTLPADTIADPSITDEHAQEALNS